MPSAPRNCNIPNSFYSARWLSNLLAFFPSPPSTPAQTCLTPSNTMAISTPSNSACSLQIKSTCSQLTPRLLPILQGLIESEPSLRNNLKDFESGQCILNSEGHIIEEERQCFQRVNLELDQWILTSEGHIIKEERVNLELGQWILTSEGHIIKEERELIWRRYYVEMYIMQQTCSNMSIENDSDCEEGVEEEECSIKEYSKDNMDDSEASWSSEYLDSLKNNIFDAFSEPSTEGKSEECFYQESGISNHRFSSSWFPFKKKR
ncbi:hypothetical protein PPACK8108_LOCUS10115 [Phakopsora pachyrhizi]|uniref:Uncharacterized protein n=1 Tax=Phakopsora pachyrhizi TaxID=170000 RepID=A0AAV0B110_PHAPC|nr:hypothetical protein PPACK8108_LOCUS10115 [Phakopsora pachyrhizi]